MESRPATGPINFLMQQFGIKTLITFSIKIIYISIQVVEEFKKNFNTELNTVPLYVFDGCFVQLKKKREKVQEVCCSHGRYFERKFKKNLR